MLQNSLLNEDYAKDEAPRVLIMEDEFIVALDLTDLAHDMGFSVEGPYATLADGVRAIEQNRPDAAILDVQLADGEVFPLADALIKLGVPIIFHSGHADRTQLVSRYPSARAECKPCAADVIVGHLVNVTSHPR